VGNSSLLFLVLVLSLIDPHAVIDVISLSADSSNQIRLPLVHRRMTEGQVRLTQERAPIIFLYRNCHETNNQFLWLQQRVHTRSSAGWLVRGESVQPQMRKQLNYAENCHRALHRSYNEPDRTSSARYIASVLCEGNTGVLLMVQSQLG